MESLDFGLEVGKATGNQLPRRSTLTRRRGRSVMDFPYDGLTLAHTNASPRLAAVALGNVYVLGGGTRAGANGRILNEVFTPSRFGLPKVQATRAGRTEWDFRLDQRS
jgi:hypothetical protein